MSNAWEVVILNLFQDLFKWLRLAIINPLLLTKPPKGNKMTVNLKR